MVVRFLHHVVVVHHDSYQTDAGSLLVGHMLAVAFALAALLHADMINRAVIDTNVLDCWPVRGRGRVGTTPVGDHVAQRLCLCGRLQGCGQPARLGRVLPGNVGVPPITAWSSCTVARTGRTRTPRLSDARCRCPRATVLLHVGFKRTSFSTRSGSAACWRASPRGRCACGRRLCGSTRTSP